jgi:peptidase MA superfamily protein
MGEALRGDVEARRRGRGSRAKRLALFALALLCATGARAQAPEAQRLDRGRFTIVAFPKDLPLARTLLDEAARNDTFPGLPRPRDRALIAIAPDTRTFREWTGAGAPDWGAAIAIPDEHRIVMQGSGAGSDAGDPRSVLRHELAHLALHEQLGALPPRWFDEGYAGYAAGEWSRDEVLSANIGLVLHGIPASLDSLEDGFHGGSSRASGAYALAYRAVSDLAALDQQRGLALFFSYWRQSGSMDLAMRRAYGLTKSGFESQWRSRTMRRYGVLAVVANLSLLFALLGLLLLPLFLVRRGRDRRRLAELRAADAVSDRAMRASSLDALLGAALESDAMPPPARSASDGSNDKD